MYVSIYIYIFLFISLKKTIILKSPSNKFLSPGSILIGPIWTIAYPLYSSSCGSIIAFMI